MDAGEVLGLVGFADPVADLEGVELGDVVVDEVLVGEALGQGGEGYGARGEAGVAGGEHCGE